MEEALDDAPRSDASPSPSPSPSPRPSKPPLRPAANKKLKAPSAKQRSAAAHRLALFHSRPLLPKPFLPPSPLPHLEKPLLLLGLWSFASAPLPCAPLRRDLLTDLVAHYDAPSRRSLVRNSRVSLCRAALAHAFQIPIRRPDLDDPSRLLLAEDATASALEGFLWNYFVIGEEEGILPDAAREAAETVRRGEAWRVDWAGLLWALVEKDILDAPQSGISYYASHLQQVILHQKPALFEYAEKVEEEEPLLEVPLVEEPEQAAVNVVEDPTGDGHTDTAEECAVDPEVVTANDAGQIQWSSGEGAEHGLRCCTSGYVPSVDYEDEERGGDVMDEDAGRCREELAPKFPDLDGSNDLLQDVGVGNDDPFCGAMHTGISGEFLDPRDEEEERKVMAADCIRAGSPSFGNTGKRASSEVEDEDEEEDEGIQPFAMDNHPQKRMRTESWGHTPPFYAIDQVSSWAEKAKIEMMQKEQDMVNAQMQLHCLEEIIQQKDQMIETLERSMMEEQQKRQLEIRHFQQEHGLMSNMVLGYQKALRETRGAFAQYRKQFPQGEEPIYKDVGGPGGAVMTARELERHCREILEMEIHRLRKMDLENRMVIRMVLEFTDAWSSRFKSHQDDVDLLVRRLDDLCEETDILETEFYKARSSALEDGVGEVECEVPEEVVVEDKNLVLEDRVHEIKREVLEDGVDGDRSQILDGGFNDVKSSDEITE